MNILMIGTTDSSGGAAKISQEVRRYLQASGHTVSFFVADKNTDDPDVQVIPRSRLRKTIGFVLGTENLIDTDWILETEAFKNADLVNCHNLHGRFFNLNTLQKMSHLKPVVWTLHDEWAITPHCACTFQGSEMRNGLYVCPSIDTPPRLLWDNSAQLAKERNALYRNSTLHLVTPSLWLRERVQNTVLKEQDVRHIPNGIDTSVFKRMSKEDARKELNLPLDKKIVLFIADDPRINPWKGWVYAEQIAAQYRADTSVLFVCAGNREEYAPDTNIEYRGRISGAENLSRYYSAADVLLFTSVAENFPLVILEAMSCGLPIVAFNVGGVREALIHKTHGYVAEYKNIEDTAKGLAWALALTPEEQETLGTTAQTRVRTEYDIRLMNERYQDLFTELVEAKNQTR